MGSGTHLQGVAMSDMSVGPRYKCRLLPLVTFLLPSVCLLLCKRVLQDPFSGFRPKSSAKGSCARPCLNRTAWSIGQKNA